MTRPSRYPLPSSITCHKCGGKIIILGRTGGGAIAVRHTCQAARENNE